MFWDFSLILLKSPFFPLPLPLPLSVSLSLLPLSPSLSFLSAMTEVVALWWCGEAWDVADPVTETAGW